MRILKNILTIVCLLLLGSCNKATVEPFDDSPSELILGKWKLIDMAGDNVDPDEPIDELVFTLNFSRDEKVESSFLEFVDEDGNPIITESSYKWSPDHSFIYIYKDDEVETIRILKLNRNQLSYEGDISVGIEGGGECFF